MSSDALVVNGILGAIIIFLLWWFFSSMMPSSSLINPNEPILITVENGGYMPSHLEIPYGKSVKLHFFRKDASPCSGSVIFPQLNYAYQLPINEKVEVSIPPLTRGEIDFSCDTGDIKGKLYIV